MDERLRGCVLCARMVAISLSRCESRDCESGIREGFVVVVGGMDAAMLLWRCGEGGIYQRGCCEQVIDN